MSTHSTVIIHFILHTVISYDILISQCAVFFAAEAQRPIVVDAFFDGVPNTTPKQAMLVETDGFRVKGSKVNSRA